MVYLRYFIQLALSSSLHSLKLGRLAAQTVHPPALPQSQPMEPESKVFYHKMRADCAAAPRVAAPLFLGEWHLAMRATADLRCRLHRRLPLPGRVQDRGPKDLPHVRRGEAVL